MKKTAKGSTGKSTAKAVIQKKSATAKTVTRAEKYALYYQAEPSRASADGFIPQVHGYGIPAYSQVGSFAGV